MFRWALPRVHGLAVQGPEAPALHSMGDALGWVVQLGHAWRDDAASRDSVTCRSQITVLYMCSVSCVLTENHVSCAVLPADRDTQDTTAVDVT